MKRSRLVMIDNIFLPFFWVVKQLKSIFPRKVKSNETSLVLKYFGVGSITRIASVLRDANPEKDVVFLTLKRNRSAVDLLGLNAIYINDNNSLTLFFSSIQRIFTIWKLRRTEVVDMERSSNIAGIYSMIISIRKKHASFQLEGENSERKNRRVISLKDKAATSGIAELLEVESKLPEKKFVETSSVQRIMININAGGYLPERKFPMEKWVSLTKGLAQTFPDACFFLSGLESEKERVQAFSNKLSEFLNDSKNVMLAGEQNLNSFVQSLQQSDLFLTNDSGPLHLAHYFDVKTVAIWGPTSSSLVGYPNSNKMLNLTHQLPCGPCFISPKSDVAKTCSGELTCFQQMNISEMITEINAFLGKMNQ